MFPNLFYKANITFTLNLNKVSIKDRPIFLIHMNIKLIKIFANGIQLHTKKIIHHNKVGLILRI